MFEEAQSKLLKRLSQHKVTGGIFPDLNEQLNFFKVFWEFILKSRKTNI